MADYKSDTAHWFCKRGYYVNGIYLAACSNCSTLFECSDKVMDNYHYCSGDCEAHGNHWIGETFPIMSIDKALCGNLVLKWRD